jgi:hypothetical protein
MTSSGGSQLGSDNQSHSAFARREVHGSLSPTQIAAGGRERLARAGQWGVAMAAARAAIVGGTGDKAAAKAAQKAETWRHIEADRHGRNHATIFKSIRPSWDSSPSSSVM